LYRRDVEESLRQWLDEQWPNPRLNGMREALQAMLPVPSDSPDQPPVATSAPAKQPLAEPKQPSAEQEDQKTDVNEQEPRRETVFLTANTDAEVAVVASMDLLPVLALIGWLMDRKEEETTNPADF
jgi:hypothetical protein